MKKNGFTLIELLATLVILSIISTIGAISYTGYINNTKKKSYEDAEITMQAAAESFLTYCSTSPFATNECQAIPNNGESIEVELSTLTENGFMNKVVDQSKNQYCSGKVIVANHTVDGATNYNLEYKACLICSDYNSVGCE